MEMRPVVRCTDFREHANDDSEESRQFGHNETLQSPRFRALNDGIHLVAMAVERVVDDVQGRNRGVGQRQRLRIPAAEPGFVYAGAAAARRRMAQMLEELRVPLHEIGDQRLPERVIERDELEHRVVVHLADREHTREAPPQIGDHAASAVVHVSVSGSIRSLVYSGSIAGTVIMNVLAPAPSR